MMCSTLSTSTANWITDRQLRSVCTTTLAMLRWTKSSPGSSPTMSLAGTRESAQPIHAIQKNDWNALRVVPILILYPNGISATKKGNNMNYASNNDGLNRPAKSNESFAFGLWLRAAVAGAGLAAISAIVAVKDG